MADISQTQKILGIGIILAAVYLVWDMGSGDAAPRKIENRPKNPRVANVQQNRRQTTESVKFTNVARTTVITPKDSALAMIWGLDPFDKSHLVDELPEIDPGSGDPAAETEIVELDDYVLSAISYRGNEAAVLINKEVLKLGDSIDGMRVEQILSNTVILSKDGKKYIIKLKSA